ncbi:unnamed protein product [Sympodiomycopsis kandeliae]
MSQAPKLSRQPSRLSTVSSALSSPSLSSAEDEAPPVPSTSASSTIKKRSTIYDDEDDSDSEDNDEDAEGEVEVSEDEMEIETPPPVTAPATTKGKKSLKVTVRPKSQPQSKKVSNNRGVKTINSDDEASEEEEEEDELMDTSTLPPAAGESDLSDEEEEDYSISLPKTARQLSKLSGGETLLELPMTDDSKKGNKIIRSEAEIALKRSEMARRRRYQSEKKLDDEKTETINRLLKKQVGRKSNRDKSKDEDEEDEEEQDRGGEEKRIKTDKGVELTRQQQKDLPRPFYRIVSSANGTSLSVPTNYADSWQRAFPPTTTTS